MNRSVDWLPALAFVCYGIVFLIGSITMSESFSGGYGHRTVPLAMSILVIALSAWVLVRPHSPVSAIGQEQQSIQLKEFVWLVSPLLALLAVYAALQIGFGYLAATLVSGITIFRLYGNGWLASFVHGIVGTAILYAIFFRLMKLYDPPGRLLELTVPF